MQFCIKNGFSRIFPYIPDRNKKRMGVIRIHRMPYAPHKKRKEQPFFQQPELNILLNMDKKDRALIDDAPEEAQEAEKSTPERVTEAVR